MEGALLLNRGEMDRETGDWAGEGQRERKGGGGRVEKRTIKNIQ